MTITRTLVTAAIAAAMITPLSASAANQSDVQTCRQVMTEQTNIDMSKYRLRLEKQKGYANMVLHMRAIPNKWGSELSSFRFTCSFAKNDVVAIRQDGRTLYAKGQTVNPDSIKELASTK